MTSLPGARRLVLAAFGTLYGLSLAAATYQAGPDLELARRAPVIVRATVVSQEARLETVGGKTWPFTFVTRASRDDPGKRPGGLLGQTSGRQGRRLSCRGSRARRASRPAARSSCFSNARRAGPGLSPDRVRPLEVRPRRRRRRASFRGAVRIWSATGPRPRGSQRRSRDARRKEVRARARRGFVSPGPARHGRRARSRGQRHRLARAGDRRSRRLAPQVGEHCRTTVGLAGGGAGRTATVAAMRGVPSPDPAAASRSASGQQHTATSTATASATTTASSALRLARTSREPTCSGAGAHQRPGRSWLNAAP